MRKSVLKRLGLALVLGLATMVTLASAPSARAQDDEETPQNATLKIGDESPEIWVSGWWQEKVPAPRAKGKVYVVDFWAS